MTIQAARPVQLQLRQVALQLADFSKTKATGLRAASHKLLQLLKDGSLIAEVNFPSLPGPLRISPTFWLEVHEGEFHRRISKPKAPSKTRTGDYVEPAFTFIDEYLTAFKSKKASEAPETLRGFIHKPLQIYIAQRDWDEYFTASDLSHRSKQDDPPKSDRGRGASGNWKDVLVWVLTVEVERRLGRKDRLAAEELAKQAIAAFLHDTGKTKVGFGPGSLAKYATKFQNLLDNLEDRKRE
jgi:hypothetical protein